MSKPKKTEIDLNKPYEENEVKLRGTVVFSAVTIAMILFSFVTIYYLNKWVEEGIAAHEKKNASPMALTKEQLLPPEPRLQSAPGFGVGEGANRINLELTQPAAEYLEVQRRWHDEERHGTKDGSGAVLTLPVAEAKAKFLEQGAKQRPGEEAVKSMADAKSYITGASSGRSAISR